MAQGALLIKSNGKIDHWKGILGLGQKTTQHVIAQ